MTDWLHQPVRYWQAGGPLLLPLAAVCFALWTCYFRTRRQLAQALRLPPDFNTRLPASRDEWRRRVSTLPGAIPRAAARALEAHQSGAPAGKAFDDCQTGEINLLKKNLLILAALTTVAPLLGLLGTVAGMVGTFQAVAESAGDTTSRVASGISQALITTQFGLVVAIPGFFALARLQRRLEHGRILFLQSRSRLMLALQYPEPKNLRPAPEPRHRP